MLLAATALIVLSAIAPHATRAQTANPQTSNPQTSSAQVPARRVDTTRVSLDELVRTALVQNLRVRSAAAETRAAGTYSSATRSRYDPVLNIGGQSDGSGVGGQLVGQLPTGASYLLGSVAPSTLPGEPLYPNALVASVNQPLLRGLGLFSARNSIRAVDEGVAASRARFARTMDEVAASIGFAYAVLVERHRQEAIATRSLKRADELRTAYTDLRALNRITDVDLYTAQLAVSSRRATLLDAQRSRQQAEDELIFAVYGERAGTVLARGDVVFMPRDTVVAAPALSPLDDAVARAITVRPDVVAARHDAERSRYQSQYARNAAMPTLNVSGSFSSTRNDAVSNSGNNSRVEDWSAGFVLSRPLLNAGASAERQRTEAAQTQAAVQLVDAENTVRAEVRAAYRDIALGREQVALAVEASGLAGKQYDGERERLRLGLSDIFRVLQYEEQVARVERAEADAWLAYSVAVVKYRLALGAAAGG